MKGPNTKPPIVKHKAEVEAVQPGGEGGRRAVRHRHRAPRIAGASTTSCAAARAARATRARSRFFLSLEDDLMRIFGSDRMGGMLTKLGLKDGEAIVHPWINKALEKAQKKVEARNFDMRKNLLKYDDVMNDQRKEVYAQRRAFMNADDVLETIAGDAAGDHRRPGRPLHPRERLSRAVGPRRRCSARCRTC